MSQINSVSKKGGTPRFLLLICVAIAFMAALPFVLDLASTTTHADGGFTPSLVAPLTGDPIGEATRDIIERERALDMARQLHALPRREVVVNRAARFANFVFHCLDFGIEIELMFVGMVL